MAESATYKEMSEVWNEFHKNQNKQARLTIPELSRTLVQQCSKCVLSVISAEEDTKGFPSTSIVAYAADDDGKPVFSLSDLAVHTRHLRKDDRVSIIVPEREDLNIRHQRVTLTGRVDEVDTDIERLKELYRKKHPTAYYVDFGDFHMFKMMDVNKAYFVVDSATASARTGSISGSEFLDAVPDLIAPFSRFVCKHMNKDHAADNLALAEAYTGFEVQTAEFFRVDRLGVDLKCIDSNSTTFTCRIAFLSPAMNRAEMKERVIEITEKAHEKTNNKYKMPT